MKKLIVILLSLSLFACSRVAIASVHGMWNMDTIEKRSLKVGKAKPAIEVENFSDVWVFKDDGTFEFKENASSGTPLFTGIWSQKGSNFKVDLTVEQMRLFIESELLSSGLPATATIKKLHVFGSEKKDRTIKGKYQIKADLVFADLSKGTLDINGNFTGTLPYDAAEHFPLGQGDTWTFHEKEWQGQTLQEDATETYVIMGSEKIRGNFVPKRVELDNDDYELISNANGIQYYKDYESDAEDDSISDKTINTYSPPIMYVPPRLSVGTRHSFKSTVMHKSSSEGNLTAKITGEMVVEGIEDVTVAAGTFQSCLKIRVSRHAVASKIQYEEFMESVMWLAKGVGTVREMSRDTAFIGGVFQEEFSDEVELLSATVGGVTYP